VALALLAGAAIAPEPAAARPPASERGEGCKPPRGGRRLQPAPTTHELAAAPDAALLLLSDATVSTWKRRAADPEHTAFEVQNTGAGPTTVEWVALNGRTVFRGLAEIQAEIDAVPPEADGSAATRVFRFVTDNRTHGLPLTTQFQWFLTPTLFFNSSGVALCGEAAEQVNMLATDRALPGREWGLSGHVVAEVEVGTRWQMYDADYGVYFLNRAGQIASVAELGDDPSLITDPVLRLETPGPWSPYNAAYASLFSTQGDNFVRRVTPRVTAPPRPVSFVLPRGASLRFPGRFAVAPPDYRGDPVVAYANLMLRLPAGSSGLVANPFLLHTLRGSGHVALGAEVFEIGSPELQAEIDARLDALEEIELLDAQSTVELVYLVNPLRWWMQTENALSMRKEADASLAIRLVALGSAERDTDLDGVGDDGGGNGVVGDLVCTSGEGEGCDDNCLGHANPSQLDADADGRGNACDGDFDQDELITDADLAVIGACVAGGGSPTGRSPLRRVRPERGWSRRRHGSNALRPPARHPAPERGLRDRARAARGRHAPRRGAAESARAGRPRVAIE
jgi:hypothetical protein